MGCKFNSACSFYLPSIHSKGYKGIYFITKDFGLAVVVENGGDVHLNQDEHSRLLAYKDFVYEKGMVGVKTSKLRAKFDIFGAPKEGSSIDELSFQLRFKSPLFSSSKILGSDSFIKKYYHKLRDRLCKKIRDKIEEEPI